MWVEKFENRSTFGEDIDKRLRLTFGATLYFNTIKMNIRQNTKHLRYDTIQEFNVNWKAGECTQFSSLI